MKHLTASRIATILDGLRPNQLNEFSAHIESLTSFCGGALNSTKNKAMVPVVLEDMEKLAELKALLDKLNEELLS